MFHKSDLAMRESDW